MMFSIRYVCVLRLPTIASYVYEGFSIAWCLFKFHFWNHRFRLNNYCQNGPRQKTRNQEKEIVYFFFIVPRISKLQNFVPNSKRWTTENDCGDNAIKGPIFHINLMMIFLRIGQPRPLFPYFRSFQTRILQKNCRLQRDLNSNFGVEDEHAEHLTATTALERDYLE